MTWNTHVQVETLWRCSGCGKWSHAVKKPASHQRPVFEEPATDVPILNHYPVLYDANTEPISRESWWVRCGPFERWEAVRRVTQ